MTTNTPGYDRRITITIKTNKAGKRRATFWSMQTMRNLPLPIDTADLFLAMDLADLRPIAVTLAA